MADTPRADVTVAVPAYRSGHALDEALASIAAQTYENHEVLVSLDGPDEATEAVIGRYLDDPRFHLVVQPCRLGWVGNVSWLAARVTTRYWCLHSHDDVLAPTCLEELVGHLDHTPEAVVAFGDIATIGTHEATIMQPSVTGSAFARQLCLLADHWAAVAFHGVARSDAVRAAAPLRDDGRDGFSADTVWMTQLAAAGELHRVPRILYYKRYGSGTLHSKWFEGPADDRAQAWVDHCATMAARALAVDTSAPQRRLLWAAAIARLVLPVARQHFGVDEVDASRLVHWFVDGIAGEVDVERLLATDRNELVSWSLSVLAA